jgi:alpha-L-fucosidase 2
MKKAYLIISIFALCGICSFASPVKGALPREVLDSLRSYNVRYDRMAKNGSAESMPLGNGDITVNAWVEESHDLMLYIGKMDSWSEATRLLKVGRVRVRLSPNPFTEDCTFSQTLDLADAAVVVEAKSKVGNVKIKIWVDANQPVVRLDFKCSKPLEIFISDDRMRPEKYTLDPKDDFVSSSFRGMEQCPYPVWESADTVINDDRSVIWAHRNEASPYEMMLERQNVGSLIGKYPDPYLHRTFGAAITGKNLVKVDQYTMATKSAIRSCSVGIPVLTAQTETLDGWVEKLRQIDAGNADFTAHSLWWRNFWNRSWIFISGDKDARVLTRSWLLQRYMIACQGRGAYPIKFNGGSFTFDYKGHDADYRLWGPGFWHQNTRFCYWPLLASGDYDLMKPWFDYYMNMLPFQADVTRVQFGHEGAYFPETMNIFGLYLQDDWGWDNPGKASENRWIRYHWTGSLETLTMMLYAYRHTNDEQFAKDYIVPFSKEILRFFARHWPRIGHTINFIPANSIEQFWDCLNPTPYIAGIKYDIKLLRQLPKGIVPQDLLKEWDELEAALPAIPIRDGKILPAEEYGIGRNAENPELYTIFPFMLYAKGLPDEDMALRTYAARVFHESNACWSQDNIQAAYLGLAEDAARFSLKKTRALNKDVGFPAFWDTGDYIPDLDNGGSMAMGLECMLLQDVEGETRVLPAWPSKWKVWFKLHAENGKVIEKRL